VAEHLTVSAWSDLVLPRYTRPALIHSVHRTNALKSKRWLLPGDWSNFVFARSRVILLIQSVPGGKINILGGHSTGHSKQETLYEHVSHSERFPT
jgi:hypothetical protein